MIVVVLAVVAIAATQMMGTAKETQKSIGEQTKKIGQMASESMKSEEGDYCTDSADCRDGRGCEGYRCI